MTKDDWLTTNLLDRKGTNTPFKLTIKPTKFDKISYQDAVIKAAREIGSLSDKIFISLSGGMDSEAVVRYFHAAGVKVHPIIVSFTGNELERQYAFRVCRELNIKPIVLEMTNLDIIKYYALIDRYVDMVALHSISTIRAAVYAKLNDGIMITGEHMICDDDHINIVECFEWDFYHSMISSSDIGFFLYSPELVYSMITELRRMGDTAGVQEGKSRLYNVIWRPKINHKYDREVYDAIRAIKNTHLETKGLKYVPLEISRFKFKISEFLDSMIAA